MKLDETWTVFTNFSANISEFNREFVPEIFLKPQANKDIKENFRVIKKLLEHSYFEYQFYDVATLKSLLAFEMALKLRYKEVNAEEWPKKKRLVQLLEWFQNQNYFEVYNDDYLKMIRDIRNLLAHPAQHSFSGPHSRNLIENILDLINGLYEDPRLRMKRMELTSKIITKLHEFGNGSKCVINNSIYFAFNAWPAFINNKVSPEEVYFYFNPIFTIPDSVLESTNLVYPEVVLFKGNSILFKDASFTMKDSNGSVLTVSAIDAADEKRKFNDWVDRYEYYCKPGLGYIYPDGAIVDTFSLHLREFHKLNSQS